MCTDTSTGKLIVTVASWILRKKETIGVNYLQENKN